MYIKLPSFLLEIGNAVVGLGTNGTLLLLVVRMSGLLVVVEITAVESGFGFSIANLQSKQLLLREYNGEQKLRMYYQSLQVCRNRPHFTVGS